MLERAAADGIRFVNLQFTDIMGMVKTVTIPVHKLEDAIDHGLWFDGSSIEGFARIHESDMYLQPDLSTFASIPWDRGQNPTAKVICDVFTPDGEAFDGDPRDVLQAAARPEPRSWATSSRPARSSSSSCLRTSGPSKVESLPHDQAGYFDVTTDLAADVRKEMVNALGGAWASSSRRATTRWRSASTRSTSSTATALPTADNAVTFRVTLKAIAQRHGLYATFMPKPFFGINGSGMHTHQSLADAQTGETCSTTRTTSTACPTWRGSSSPASSRTRAACAPSSRRWSIRTSGWCRATRRRSTSRWARINRSALIRMPQTTRGTDGSDPHRAALPGPELQPVPGVRRDAGGRPGRRRSAG